MGSPLGPTHANFFLATVETKLLAQNLDCSPKLYVRYVVDIFAKFKEEKSCCRFLNVLNHPHKNLKFTMKSHQAHSHSWTCKSISTKTLSKLESGGNQHTLVSFSIF